MVYPVLMQLLLLLLLEVLLHHLHLVVSTCRQFTCGRSVPPALLLLLSRACRDLHTNTTSHMAAALQVWLLLLTLNTLSPSPIPQEQFPGQPAALGEVEQQLEATSHLLLEAYVQVILT